MAVPFPSSPARFRKEGPYAVFILFFDGTPERFKRRLESFYFRNDIFPVRQEKRCPEFFIDILPRRVSSLKDPPVKRFVSFL